MRIRWLMIHITAKPIDALLMLCEKFYDGCRKTNPAALYDGINISFLNHEIKIIPGSGYRMYGKGRC
jgi:hypothetical protein